MVPPLTDDNAADGKIGSAVTMFTVRLEHLLGGHIINELLYFNNKSKIKVVNNKGIIKLISENNYIESACYSTEPLKDQTSLSYLSPAMVLEKRNFLILGVGGGTNILQLYSWNKNIKISAVDIDPESLIIAQDYFNVPICNNINLYNNDAYDFLKKSCQEYECIIVDIFKNGHVPEIFLKDSFFSLLFDHLSKDGILIFNTNISLEQGALIQSNRKSILWNLYSSLYNNGFQTIIQNDVFNMGILYVFKSKYSIDFFRKTLFETLAKKNVDLNILASSYGVILKSVDISKLYDSKKAQQFSTTKITSCNDLSYINSRIVHNHRSYKNLISSSTNNYIDNLYTILIKHRHLAWNNGSTSLSQLGSNYYEDIIQWAKKQTSLNLNTIAYQTSIGHDLNIAIDLTQDKNKVLIYKNYLLGFFYLMQDNPTSALIKFTIALDYFMK